MYFMLVRSFELFRCRLGKVSKVIVLVVSTFHYPLLNIKRVYPSPNFHISILDILTVSVVFLVDILFTRHIMKL